jgi:hypothetical protein
MRCRTFLNYLLRAITVHQLRSQYESTADALLTKPPTRASRAFSFCRFCRQKREPTSGLEPPTCSSYE